MFIKPAPGGVRYCAVGYWRCGLLAGLFIGGAGYCTGGVVTVLVVTGVVLLFTDGVVYWLGELTGGLCYWWSLLLVVSVTGGGG